MRAWLLWVTVVACGKVPAPTPDATTNGDFTVSIAAPSGFLRRGGTATATVTVARSGVFAGDVSLAGMGLPTSITFDPLTIANPSTTGTLVLHADPATTEGTQMLMFNGTSGSVSHGATVAVTIAGAPGTLDESFATAGKFTAALGANALVGRGVLVASDGGIIASGVNLGMSQTVVVKVTADGMLDANFGTAGIVTTGAGSFAEGIAIAETSSGRVVVAGVANGNGASDNNFGLFQYTKTGTLDTTFGSSGVAAYDPGSGTYAEYHSVIVMQDGSILGLGTDFGTATTAHALHYSTAGVLDSTFDAPQAGISIEAALLQADGKVVAAGSSSGMWIARYNVTGGLDSGFGTGGMTTTTGGQTFSGVVAVSGGKLIGVGHDGTHAVLVRYNANGSPDLTFGTNGVSVTTTNMISLSPNAAVVDAAGKIYYVGCTPLSACMSTGGTGQLPTVARFNADGSADSSFGTNGIAAIDFGLAGTNQKTGGYGIALDAMGRIVFSGEAGPSGTQRLVIGRLWP